LVLANVALMLVKAINHPSVIRSFKVDLATAASDRSAKYVTAGAPSSRIG
jgi:hypothetical protein